MSTEIDTTEHSDLDRAPLLGRAVIRQLFWRSFLLQAAFNFERFQNLGWWWGLKPVLQKLYPNKQDLAAAYQRHLVFFNTHPWTVGPIFGVVASMEERRARGDADLDDESINSVKVSMMGPLAGIGDSLVFGALRPVLSGVCAALAVSGNPVGPILFFVGINAIHVAMRWYGVKAGYTYGVRFFEKLNPAQITRLKEAATMVGLVVVGALVANLLNIGIPLTYSNGDAEVSVQNAVDQVLPSALPLIATLLVFWLIRKRISATWVLLIVTIVGLVGGYFGFLGVPK
jgi:PTS system mannose-specific IID component